LAAWGEDVRKEVEDRLLIFKEREISLSIGGSGNALNCSLLRQLQQPLDGLKGLGADWSALNVATGIAKRKTASPELF